MTDLKKKIDRVLEKNPSLNAFGFGLFDSKGYSVDKKEKELQEGRKEVYKNIEEVQHVVTWLTDVEKIKNINTSQGSYSLKHDAEKTAPKGYIQNGCFIIGAIIAGFSFRKKGPNACFNMSKRSLKIKLK